MRKILSAFLIVIFAISFAHAGVMHGGVFGIDAYDPEFRTITGGAAGFIVDDDGDVIAKSVVITTALSLGNFTVATRPAATTANQYITVTDGASVNDCTTGGGTDRVLCRSTGAAWEPVGDGNDGLPVGGTAGDLMRKTADGTEWTSAISVDFGPYDTHYVSPTSQTLTGDRGIDFINADMRVPAATNVSVAGAVTAAALSAQYIDWNEASGPTSIANKPTIPSLTISRTEFLPVAWMIDGAAAPAAVATVDLGTRQVKGRSFQGDTADKDLEMFWQAPIDIIDGDSGTAGFQVKWRPIYIITSATGPASGESVAFALQACSSGSGDTGDCTVGTASIHADEDLDAHAQYDIVYGAYTAITVTDGAAAEGWFMKLYRDQDNAQDDYVQAVSLVGIEIKYKATMADNY